jgi:hypothetical protein
VTPYNPEPLNSFTDMRAIARQEAVAALQNQSLLSSMVPGSLPQNAVITPFVTALPITANNGDEIRFLADDTNGVVWHLRYRSSAPSDYRWEFIGGPPLHSEVAATESTASTSYTTSGFTALTVTLPFDGDYMISGGAKQNNGTDTSGARMSFAIGAAAAAEADRLTESYQAGATSVTAAQSRTLRKTGLTAVTLTANYRADTGGTANFWDRWMSVIPVRVGRS